MHSFLTSSLVNTRSANEPYLRMNDVSLSEAYGMMRRIGVPYMTPAQTHMTSFTGPTNNSASIINLNFSLGRNEQVYNIHENNNQHEPIRYISEQPIAMHSSWTSSLVNTRSVNEIFSINPSRVYDDVSLSEVYGMRRIDVPYMPAIQTHTRSFTFVTNNSADINLNLSLGRNEQVNNTSETNNQNEAIRYISDGVDETMQTSLTSSLVNPRSVNEIFSMTNNHPRMNVDDVSLSEVYGMRRIDVPYMPVAQTHMRSFTSPTNNSASINLNLSLGLSSSSSTFFAYAPSQMELEESSSSYFPYAPSQRELGENSSSYFPYAPSQRELEESSSSFFPYAPSQRELEEGFFPYAPSQRELEEGFFPYAPSQRELEESSSSFFPYAPSQRELEESSSSLFPYAPSQRELEENSSSFFPYAPSQRELGENSSSFFPYVPSARTSIYEHGESSSSYFPYAPPARSSMPWNQHSLGSTSTTIQIGGNYEQQLPHIRFRHDPELMRATIREMMMRIEEQRSHMINERGLTEDEIMKYICFGHFVVTDEETSENKELCCICQEAFVNGEEIGKLDCAHIFHLNCIKEWLSEKNICPLCKRRGLFVGDDAIDLC
ncbi:unnamed protein product [Trifolium pratense]|uniref:Uncharacterized protein n=1 Tax=Trifolium pratense TaxID=57577 RepID=A0ACB0ITQ5_TRIPR|nr:unnamed protein product [Trifolium pratense]